MVPVREMLDLPFGVAEGVDGGHNCLTVENVRRSLHLPVIRHSRFLGPDCWLAGGQVLRWVCGAEPGTPATSGDFDFFFPSIDALNATALAMFDCGFSLHGYRASPRGIRAYLKNQLSDDEKSAIQHRPGYFEPITQEMVDHLGVTCIELRSPEKEKIHLVTVFCDSPLQTIARFDFSICQLALDETHLTFGSWTWHDLLHRRFRSDHISWPDGTLLRLFKYTRRGFLPYPRTVATVTRTAIAWIAGAVVHRLSTIVQRTAPAVRYTE